MKQGTSNTEWHNALAVDVFAAIVVADAGNAVVAFVKIRKKKNKNTQIRNKKHFKIKANMNLKVGETYKIK